MTGQRALECMKRVFACVMTSGFIYSWQDELESYPFKSIYRCDAINTEKHFPSLLLLVCQNADQKKPDIQFFNCEAVKVSHNPSELPPADLTQSGRFRFYE